MWRDAYKQARYQYSQKQYVRKVKQNTQNASVKLVKDCQGSDMGQRFLRFPDGWKEVTRVFVGCHKISFLKA